MTFLDEFLERPEGEEVSMEIIKSVYQVTEEHPFAWLMYINLNPGLKENERYKLCEIIKRLQTKLHRINQQNLAYLSRHEK